MDLKWDPPKNDGGAPILKYIVEKKPKFGDWEKASFLITALYNVTERLYILLVPLLYCWYLWTIIPRYWWCVPQVGSVPAEQTNAHVPGLEEGQEYEFRVIPVNEAGPGEPSDETKRVLCKARRGMWQRSNFYNVLLDLDLNITPRRVIVLHTC